MSQGNQMGMFSSEEFRQLAPKVEEVLKANIDGHNSKYQVDFFSLMTYN